MSKGVTIPDDCEGFVGGSWVLLLPDNDDPVGSKVVSVVLFLLLDCV